MFADEARLAMTLVVVMPDFIRQRNINITYSITNN